MTSIKTWIAQVFAGLVLLGAALAVWAEEARPPDVAEVRYLPLQPAFVCNFGLAHDGHMMYVKTDIAVRLSSRDAELAARNHLPALRNSLVLLLSRQDEASVSTSAGRESIRSQALAELNEILLQEEGVEYIDDLMFTNFVVQR
jgi:flagellar FliL protein